MTVKSGEEKQQYDVIKGINPAGGEGEMLVLRAEDARRRSEEELRLIECFGSPRRDAVYKTTPAVNYS